MALISCDKCAMAFSEIELLNLHVDEEHVRDLSEYLEESGMDLSLIEKTVLAPAAVLPPKAAGNGGECAHCGMGFESVVLLQQHNIIFHDEEEAQVDSESEMSSPSSPESMNAGEDSKLEARDENQNCAAAAAIVGRCNECGRQFYADHQMLQHFKSVILSGGECSMNPKRTAKPSLSRSASSLNLAKPGEEKQSMDKIKEEKKLAVDETLGLVNVINIKDKSVKELMKNRIQNNSDQNEMTQTEMNGPANEKSNDWSTSVDQSVISEALALDKLAQQKSALNQTLPGALHSNQASSLPLTLDQLLKKKPGLEISVVPAQTGQAVSLEGHDQSAILSEALALDQLAKEKSALDQSVEFKSCKLCKKRFQGQNNLSQHMKITHQQYIASLVESIILDSSIINEENGETKIDNEESADVKEDNVEVSEAGNECKSCKQRFRRASGLMCHVKLTHDGIPEVKNDIESVIGQENEGEQEEMIEEVNEKSDEDMDSDEENYEEECQVCGKVYNDLIPFKNHIKMHDKMLGGKPYAGSMTKTEVEMALEEWDVNNDVRKDENNEKPSVNLSPDKSKDNNCTACGKCFQSKGNMLRHIKDFHNTKENFGLECTSCEKRFQKSFQLYRHMRKDHDAKEIISTDCAECGKAFSSHHCMLRHIKSVHRKIRDHKCEKCGTEYAERRLLRKHNQYNHSEDKG